MLGFRKNNSEKYKGGHEEWDFYHFFSSHNKSFTFSWYVSKCKIDHVRVENKYKTISAKCTRNQILEELDGDFTFCDRKLENIFINYGHPRSQNVNRGQHVKVQLYCTSLATINFSLI